MIFFEVKHKDILERLVDLQKQATTEHSHNYVASVCTAAIHEIADLRFKTMAPYMAGLQAAKAVAMSLGPHKKAITVVAAIAAMIDMWRNKKPKGAPNENVL